MIKLTKGTTQIEVFCHDLSIKFADVRLQGMPAGYSERQA